MMEGREKSKPESNVRAEARRRLLCVKGHVEGVLRMLDEGTASCEDVLKQLRAIDGAMARVGDLVLRSHLQQHVAAAKEGRDEKQLVEELMGVLKYR
jgi:DNA-binding FrmR family transcriptional regulator